MTMILMSMVPAPVGARGPNVSGGADGRYTHAGQSQEDEIKLQGLFLNLRQVWSDEAGDRWIGVAQADGDDNFQTIRPYQAYLQYKGPLGKWNARAGHFLLPFGLLATHDTERLVLQGLEDISLGIRKDTGLGFLGHLSQWDYALALSDGLSDHHFWDARANPLLTARVAYVQDDWHSGVSTLIGKPLVEFESSDRSEQVTEQRIALDATKSVGPLTARAEGIGGLDDGRAVGGGVILADYALTDKLELNSRLALWHKEADRYFAGLGLTYRIWRGLLVRVADNYEFGKEDSNEITTQLYFDFSHQF